MPTAEPYIKHNYNGKGRYFLGYLQDAKVKWVRRHIIRGFNIKHQLK